MLTEINQGRYGEKEKLIEGKIGGDDDKWWWS